MKKSELKQMIKETIEAVQVEAAKNSITPSGTTYTFNQLNKLLRGQKIFVFIQSQPYGELVQIDNEEAFFTDKNDDGEQAIYAAARGYKYEFGSDFENVYVAQKVNIK
jgi:hypothetical protein